MKIFLWGYMGSGKSTIGKVVASQLDVPFYDLDIEFEKRYKIEIYKFFEAYGEEAFRKLEQGLLHEIAINNEFVISTGGGTPCFFDNALFMNSIGATFYLKYESDVLYNRLKQSPKKRPLFSDTEEAVAISSINQQIEKREYFYLKSKFIIEPKGQTAQQIAKIICSKIQK